MQSGGFDTSSYPKPVPQASFLDMLQQSNEIELQQREIKRRQMQLNEQRYLQEREQREFEARAAEVYRKRRAGEAQAAEAFAKRHANDRPGKPLPLAPTKVSN